MNGCICVCVCREYVGNEYALNAGYVQVAEKNNIIVLFPQVTNKIPDGTNPDGCWDWWVIKTQPLHTIYSLSHLPLGGATPEKTIVSFIFF